jgi:hypothetical protein
MRYHVSMDALTCETIGDDALFIHRAALANCIGYHRYAPCAAAAMINLIRVYAGPRWAATRIEFDLPRPASAQDWEAAFGCAVAFDRPRLAIVFPRDRLAHRRRGPSGPSQPPRWAICAAWCAAAGWVAIRRDRVASAAASSSDVAAFATGADQSARDAATAARKSLLPTICARSLAGRLIAPAAQTMRLPPILRHPFCAKVRGAPPALSSCREMVRAGRPLPLRVAQKAPGSGQGPARRSTLAQ